MEAGPAEASAPPEAEEAALVDDEELPEEPPEARLPLLMEGKETLARLVPAPPRPRSERPPRNCGAINETNFSAVVTPVNRTVRSKRPPATVWTRTAEATRVASACCESCFCQSHHPSPATAAKPSKIKYLRDPPDCRCSGAEGRNSGEGGNTLGCAGTEGSGCITLHLCWKPVTRFTPLYPNLVSKCVKPWYRKLVPMS